MKLLFTLYLLLSPAIYSFSQNTLKFKDTTSKETQASLPNIYLGNNLIFGNSALKNHPLERIFDPNVFLAKFPKHLGLSTPLKVTNWSITVNNKLFEGKGSNLSDELCNAIFEAPKKSIVVINFVHVTSEKKDWKVDISLKIIKESVARTFKPGKRKPIICE